MSFLPSQVVEVNEEETTDIKEYLDYVYDETTQKFIGIGTEYESIKSWCRNAIKIPRYKYAVYPYSYGCEILDELRGKALPEEEAKEIIEYCVIDCLKVFQFIDEVEIKDITFSGTGNSKVTVKAVIKTIYGEEIEDEYNI